MLTDKAVRAYKTPNSMLADSGGLYVRVAQNGRKTFVFRSRTGGKAKYHTLGEFPRLGLAEARRKAGELQGIELGERTVSQAVEAYLARLDYLRPEQVKRRFDTDVIPDIGKKRIDRVTTEDLTNVLQKIVDRGSPVAANRTLADLRHLFSFAFEKGWIQNDPSLRITRRVVGGKERSRAVVLTDDQLKTFVGELRKERWGSTTRAALALCLLTGQRASEVLGICKEEIDGAWWTIPGERTKNGKEQKVYLTRPARLILKLVKLQGNHCTLSQALRRRKVGFTPHDTRRTMSTLMADRLGVAPHIIEKILNHSMTGVMSVYNRAEYLKERKDAWNKWARFLLKLRRAS